MSADDRRARDGIGLMLDVCFGERGRIRIAGGATCLLKSIPSGGARHPTEVFLAAFDVPGIPPGIYHYGVEHHRLEEIRAGQHRAALAHATLDLFARYDTAPAAALVFTSRVERAMWRYRDPRSFRAVLLDVGHGVAAYRHVARALGFRTYAYQKMRDGEISELLRLDRLAQPPLYVGTLV
jgi:SagB-type dehydrogenase family enzyme